MAEGEGSGEAFVAALAAEGDTREEDGRMGLLGAWLLLEPAGGPHPAPPALSPPGLQAALRAHPHPGVWRGRLLEFVRARTAHLQHEQQPQLGSSTPQLSAEISAAGAAAAAAAAGAATSAHHRSSPPPLSSSQPCLEGPRLQPTPAEAAQVRARGVRAVPVLAAGMCNEQPLIKRTPEPCACTPRPSQAAHPPPCATPCCAPPSSSSSTSTSTSTSTSSSSSAWPAQPAEEERPQQARLRRRQQQHHSRPQGCRARGRREARARGRLLLLQRRPLPLPAPSRTRWPGGSRALGCRGRRPRAGRAPAAGWCLRSGWLGSSSSSSSSSRHPGGSHQSLRARASVQQHQHQLQHQHRHQQQHLHPPPPANHACP